MAMKRLKIDGNTFPVQDGRIPTPTTDGQVLTSNGTDMEWQDLPASQPEVVTLPGPSSATMGTFTEEELAKLTGNRETAISFNGELYKQSDDRTDEGYLVYSHTGQDNTQNFFIKCITVTLSTLGWVLTSTQVGGGSKFDVLWETPNPMQSYGNNAVIEFDTSKDYNYYLIYIQDEQRQTPLIVNTLILPNIIGAYVWGSFVQGGQVNNTPSIHLGYRTFRLTENGITLGYGLYMYKEVSSSTLTWAVQANRVLPIKIIGVK